MESQRSIRRADEKKVDLAFIEPCEQSFDPPRGVILHWQGVQIDCLFSDYFGYATSISESGRFQGGQFGSSELCLSISSI